MPEQQRRKSGGSRKIGRHKEEGAKYRAFHKFEKAHIRRISKHLKRFPMDLQSGEALKRYKKLLA